MTILNLQVAIASLAIRNCRLIFILFKLIYQAFEKIPSIEEADREL
jgi:hypothetical protein